MNGNKQKLKGIIWGAICFVLQSFWWLGGFVIKIFEEGKITVSLVIESSIIFLLFAFTSSFLGYSIVRKSKWLIIGAIILVIIIWILPNLYYRFIA